MRYKAVIIGAGALGLGFLAERMADDYDICLVDLGANAEIARRIAADGGFTVNVCGLDGIEHRCVRGRFEAIAADVPSERSQYDAAARDADLILTCTSRKLLDPLIASIAPALHARDKRGWVLFCENGLDIAAAFRHKLGPWMAAADTVMSRMCRFADDGETEYEPMWPAADRTLVVEDYNLLPLDADVCLDGPFSPAFSIMSHEDFECWEDVKLYVHNGLHAFVSYHAFLEGAQHFRDVPAHIRARARSVALGELVPAIVRTRSCAKREDIEQRALSLLDRFVNPHFRDSIERGVRGVAEKLAPGERLLGGVEYLRRAGIEPAGYASVVDAARRIISLTAAEQETPR